MSRAYRKLFGGLVLVSVGCLSGTRGAGAVHYVVSWGGSYARASQQAYHTPFTEETGIEIRLEDYNGGLAQIRAQVDTGVVHWDVVDLNLDDAIRGCDEGLLEVIDPSQLAPGVDGSTPQEDYYRICSASAALDCCSIPPCTPYNSERISGPLPQTIEDFFDLERLSGAARHAPFAGRNLEFALLADGVAVDDVYAVLDTEAGIERAFRKLDTIKDQVVWWKRALNRRRCWPTAKCS